MPHAVQRPEGANFTWWRSVAERSDLASSTSAQLPEKGMGSNNGEAGPSPAAGWAADLVLGFFMDVVSFAPGGSFPKIGNGNIQARLACAHSSITRRRLPMMDSVDSFSGCSNAGFVQG
jgi:hypothetical protein